MTATDLRNEGQFIVTGTTTLSGVVNNYGRIEIGRGGRMEALQYLQFSDTAVTRVDGELLTTEDRRVEISSDWTDRGRQDGACRRTGQTLSRQYRQR